MLSWEDRTLRTLLFVADNPTGVIQQRNTLTGLGTLAPPWVFGPWLDAVRGSTSVRDLALKARESHAPVTAIWTEDWKGAIENGTGYHLKGEMTLDTDLYPDGVALAAMTKTSASNGSPISQPLFMRAAPCGMKPSTRESSSKRKMVSPTPFTERPLRPSQWSIFQPVMAGIGSVAICSARSI